MILTFHNEEKEIRRVQNLNKFEYFCLVIILIDLKKILFEAVIKNKNYVKRKKKNVCREKEIKKPLKLLVILNFFFSLINNDTLEVYFSKKKQRINKKNFFIRLEVKEEERETHENCKIKYCLPVCRFEWNQFYASSSYTRRKMETLRGIKKGWRRKKTEKNTLKLKLKEISQDT